MYKELFEDYQSLQEDYNLLRSVRQMMLGHLLDVGDVDDLQNRNNMYRRHIETWLVSNIPETSADLQRWPAEEVDAWLDFLVAYPLLYDGQEKKLIGLFWSMMSAGSSAWQRYFRKIGEICTSHTMACYVAFNESKKESAVNALWSVLEHCVTFVQMKAFEDIVRLRQSEM